MTFTTKYAPTSLNQCLFPDTATKNLVTSFARNLTSSNLVLYGPMGTGKSLMASFIGKELDRRQIASFFTLNGTNMSTAADAKAEIALLEKMTILAQFPQERRVFLIDEFDCVHRPSQLGFARFFERADIQFLLTTNHVTDIDERILSRSHLCPVTGATQQDMLLLAQRVVAAEGVIATMDELQNRVVCSNGNVRDLLNMLEGLVLQKRASSAVPTPSTGTPAPAVVSTPTVASAPVLTHSPPPAPPVRQASPVAAQPTP